MGGGVGGVGRGVGGVATAVCVRGGFEVRCMGVRRRKIRRILTKLRGGRAELQVKVGDGKVEEGGEEVYRM